MRPDAKHDRIRAYYSVLFRAWGPQHWWPAQSRFEMIVGAYLTQNTAWTNVEQALANLRRARVLSARGLRQIGAAELEQLIRPAGYFRQKARHLKLFVEFLDLRYRGSLEKLFAQPTLKLREELLSLNGIGPETADSILLYAGNHPVFVVDAYTRRIFTRHEIIAEDAAYEDIRAHFEEALKPITDSLIESGGGNQLETGAPTTHLPSRVSTAKRTSLAQVYNEMHGLIVGVGKHFCRKSKARCDECPLQEFLSKRARSKLESLGLRS